MSVALKTSLDHLPEEKRAELRRVVELILDEFHDEIEMIILYGSYARGDWVEELAPDGVNFQYQSDYDIMAITRDRTEHRSLRCEKVKNAFVNYLRAPTIQMEQATIGFFNHRLEHGYFFYADIAKEGVLLYDSGRHSLVEPRELTPAEALAKAEAHYNQWFQSAVGAVKGYHFHRSENDLKWAAFMLHQATERFLAAFLLALTDYKPRTHDLAKLTPMAAAKNARILTVFPKGSEQEKARFELLRRAYVDGRYDPNYSISREDLDYLAERVEVLEKLVRQTCLESMEKLKVAAK